MQSSPLLAKHSVAAILVALTACGPPTSTQVAASDFRTHCMSCHGLSGEGVPSLPTGHRINDKGEHWDEERLFRYLQDPMAFSQTDPRLEGRMAEPPDGLTDDQLRALARHALSLMDAGE